LVEKLGLYKQSPFGADICSDMSSDIICIEKRTVFREGNSRKTVSYVRGQISKHISRQMEAIVLIILEIFSQDLKIGEYSL